MTRRFALVGMVAVAALWGPYVYAELARRPLPAAPAQRLALAGEPEPGPAAPEVHDEVAHPATQLAPEPVAALPPLAADEPAPENAPEPVPALPPSAAEVPALTATEASALTADPAPANAAAVPAPATAQLPALLPPTAATAEPLAPASVAALPVSAEPAQPEAKARTSAEEAEAPTIPNALAPAFRSAFDRESRDALWAANEEPRLVKLFNGAGVPESAIVEVRCQRTVCRVSFNAVGVESTVRSQLYDKVRDEFGASLALETPQAESEQHASLYVLRKGYDLEH